MDSGISTDHVGLVREDQQVVTRERTAVHIGSGSLGVYATPAMLAFVEATCRDMLDELLDPSMTSVGTEVRLRHLAPTTEGETVSVCVEIISIEGILVEFKAEVWDRVERIGEARHTRAVIDVDRFLSRVSAKTSPDGDR
ncbi:MAG: thioesterase family protein [Anaerolineales bacterium]|nr:thioesterase family protein [Anaerolineales bacterium]